VKQLAAVVISIAAVFISCEAMGYDGPVVVDDANYLDGEQLVRLEHEVNVSNAEKDFFLVILTVPTLDRQRIEPYAKAIMKVWKIGRGDRDDGLLLLIVRDENLFYFHAGETAGRQISAERLEHVRKDILYPSFQRKEYLAGLAEAVEALGSDETGISMLAYLWLIPPIVLLIIIFANTVNRKRRVCPHCGRRVSPLVSTCPHCLGDLRVGQGEPCPCGSKKHYKDCCFGKHTEGRDSHRIQLLRMLDIRYLMWQSTSFGGYTGGGPGELPVSQDGAERFEGTGVAGRF